MKIPSARDSIVYVTLTHEGEVLIDFRTTKNILNPDIKIRMTQLNKSVVLVDDIRCAIRNNAGLGQYTRSIDFSLNVKSLLYDNYRMDTIPLNGSEIKDVTDYFDYIEYKRNGGKYTPESFIKLLEKNKFFSISVQLMYDTAYTFIRRNRRCVSRILAEVQNGGRK